jgi:predicted RNase H-like HicB family nuclease
MNEYVFHGIIEKEDDVYYALCLELDIATEADTLEGAKKNLREAVEGYVESVVQDGEESDFIPRPVPEKVIRDYERRFKSYLSSSRPVELYGYSEIVDAKISQAVE